MISLGVQITNCVNSRGGYRVLPGPVCLFRIGGEILRHYDSWGLKYGKAASSGITFSGTGESKMAEPPKQNKISNREKNTQKISVMQNATCRSCIAFSTPEEILRLDQLCQLI